MGILRKNIFYELVLKKGSAAVLIDRKRNVVAEFRFKSQQVWKLKLLLEKRKYIDFNWDLIYFAEKKDELKDYDYIIEPYDKKKRVIKISKRNAPLTMLERAYILQHEHTTGRWGQNIADAELNSTQDYVILNTYDHDIDYMFSESVSSKYWIYNLKTMKEVKIEKDLSYRYLHNSSGVRESGVDDVCFSKVNPYIVLLKYSDDFGKNKEIVEIELPQG